jgi:hypothetical protein
MPVRREKIVMAHNLPKTKGQGKVQIMSHAYFLSERALTNYPI